jgi:ribosomal protein S18 acetylase RimI-like enzyme
MIVESNKHKSNDIFPIWKEAWSKWHKDDPNILNKCEEFLAWKQIDGCILLAKNEWLEPDEIKAYLVFSKNWNKIHIEDLYVAEKHRKSGLATNLVQYLKNYAETFKYESITTDCDFDNTVIQEFNKRMGFKEIGRLQNYWDRESIFYKLKIQ